MLCTWQLPLARLKLRAIPLHRAIVHERPHEPPAFLTFYTIKVVTPLTEAQLAELTSDSWLFFDATTNTGLLRYDPDQVRRQIALQTYPGELKPMPVLDELEVDLHLVIHTLNPLT